MAAVDNDGIPSIRTCHRDPGSGVLMSFDDHGTPEQVGAILDRLRAHHAQAAFFPTGEWAMANLSLIERMRQDGHIVGHHTLTHARLGALSQDDPDGFYREVYPLENVSNTSPLWLRPPYEDGAYDGRVAARLADKATQLCTWTADTRDWDGSSVAQIMARLANGDEFSPEPLGPDGIVLMHMQGDHTPALIDAIMAHLDAHDLPVARPADR